MAIILNINTAFENAFINMSIDGKILAEKESLSHRNHASFIEPAIKNICEETGILLKDINAIATVNGPGSYTGLRVGLSSAKALCYALNKPLILLNSLDVMAMALKMQSLPQSSDVLFCPLIDARRMEVYTGLYNFDLELIKPYTPVILDFHFLETERIAKKIIIGGNGSSKFHEIVKFDNIIEINPLYLGKPAATLSEKAFISEKFSSLAYSEPFYLKEVYLRN